jgi:hypothetical protein
MKRLLSVAAALILVTTPARADFPYHEYQPSSLANVFALADTSCISGNKTVSIDAGKRAYAVPATWKGETRPIDSATLSILLMAEKANTASFAIPMNQLFKTEVRMTDGGKSYWLPIQDVFIDAFKAEVPPGKGATLYVTYIGCSTTAGKNVAVTINEFQAN